MSLNSDLLKPKRLNFSCLGPMVRWIFWQRLGPKLGPELVFGRDRLGGQLDIVESPANPVLGRSAATLRLSLVAAGWRVDSGFAECC